VGPASILLSLILSIQPEILYCTIRCWGDIRRLATRHRTQTRFFLWKLTTIKNLEFKGTPLLFFRIWRHEYLDACKRIHFLILWWDRWELAAVWGSNIFWGSYWSTQASFELYYNVPYVQLRHPISASHCESFRILSLDIILKAICFVTPIGRIYVESTSL